MTTNSSLQSHQAGIDVTSMPQTYKDAIRVARDLGIKYLWIDALCIVQDLTDDKIDELSRMRLYYQNALLVIAASSASTVQEGFLSFHPLQQTPCSETTRLHSELGSKVTEVPFYCPNERKGTIILNESPKIYEAAKEPLNQRAWTLQERLLCPRVLVFPSTGSFFLQCNKGERHVDTVHFGQPFGRSRMFSLSSSMWNLQGVNMKGVHKSWLMHIRDYSERSLTVPGDRPNAVAGMAEAYHYHFNMQLGDYLAGHWSQYLLESLHWRVFATQLKLAPTTALSPSWSWVSVDSPVQLQPKILLLQQFTSLVEVQFVAVRKASGKLPFGTVQAGCLSIKASIGRVCWTPSKQYRYLPSLETEDGRCIEGARTYADTAENFPMKPTAVFALPLCTSGQSSELSGLLVQLVAPSYDSLFRRIGYFELAPNSLLLTWTEAKLIGII